MVSQFDGFFGLLNYLRFRFDFSEILWASSLGKEHPSFLATLLMTLTMSSCEGAGTRMPRQRDLMAGITCKHKSFSIHKLFKINYKFVNESLFTFNDTRTPKVQVRKKCGTEVQKHVTLSIQNIRVLYT